MVCIASLYKWQLTQAESWAAWKDAQANAFFLLLVNVLVNFHIHSFDLLNLPLPSPLK